MTMPNPLIAPAHRAAVVALVLLLLSGVADRLIRDRRGGWWAAATPLATPLSELPPVIGSFVFDHDLPLDQAVLGVADVDDYLHRGYVDRVTGKRISLYVGYWGRVNVGMGHGPEVCYTGVGWTPEGAPRERGILPSETDPSQIATFALHRFSRTGPSGVERLAVAFSAVVDGRFRSSSRGAFWHRPPRFRGDDDPPFLAQVQAVAPVTRDAWEATEADLLDFVRALVPNLRNCFPQKNAPSKDRQ